MILPKTPFLILHLIGLCLSIGPVLLLDVRLSRLLVGKPVDRFDVELVGVLGLWIRIGLGLLWISGAGFLLFYGINTPEALTNPKLHAKLIVVGILTLNGILVERYAFSQLATRIGKTLLDPSDRRQRCKLLAIGAISATSWYTPLLLGAVRELNFAYALWVFLAAYLTTVVGVTACLVAITKISLSITDFTENDNHSEQASTMPVLQASVELEMAA